MEAKNCPDAEWYDVTTREDAEQKRRVYLCVKVGCDVECDREKVAVVDFKPYKSK